MKKAKKDVLRGAGKVAFWARKESIEKMLEAKHTLMATFLAHQKEVDIGYGQFRRYVNEFIRSKPKERKQAEKTAPKEKVKELSIHETFKTPTDKKDIL